MTELTPSMRRRSEVGSRAPKNGASARAPVETTEPIPLASTPEDPWAASLRRVDRMRDTDTWLSLDADHAVALFSRCFEHVNRAPCPDLPARLPGARAMAGDLLAALDHDGETLARYLADWATSERRLRRQKGEAFVPSSFRSVLSTKRLEKWARESGVELRRNAAVEWPDLGARLGGMRRPHPRHPTGIPALDDRLRGGVPESRLVIVGGAPGAGKTTLIAQIARNLARGGVAVAIWSLDEDPSAIDSRHLQSLGIPRDVAESPDDNAVERAARELGGLALHVIGEEEVQTIEEAFGGLAARHPDQPRALFVDSVQCARTNRSADLTSPRERIDDVVRTARRLSRADDTRAAVFFTSEMSRASYRSKRADEQVDDLAAFKESGGIEYSADVLLTLRTAKRDAQLVHVTVPKNRLGSRGEFALRLDARHAEFAEEAVLDETRELEDAAMRALEVRIVEFLAGEGRAAPSLNYVARRVRGRKADIADAVERLIDEGRLVRGGAGAGKRALQLAEGVST